MNIGCSKFRKGDLVSSLKELAMCEAIPRNKYLSAMLTGNG